MEKHPSQIDQPSPESLRVEQILRHRELTGSPIDDTTARIIASWWHSGQASGLYSFQSTGAISYDLIAELRHEYNDPNLAWEEREQLDALTDYIAAQAVDEDGERPPVDGWHERTRDWTPLNQDELSFEAGDA